MCAAAQANLAKSKVSLEDAERTLKRTKELKQRELVSQSELDAAQTAYDSARSQVSVTQAQVGQAQASMNQAQIDLGYTVIRSPVDGIVISRNIDVGQTVAASLSAPTLFTIANDLTKMEVHTNVDEADVGNITDGQEVSFTVDAHAQRRFRGKVNQVRNAPINVQGVVTYNSVVRINNKELLLKPGMTANVQFLVAQKEDALAIPNVALRFRPPEEKNEAQELLRQEQGRVGGRIAAAAHQPWRRQRCRRRRGPARAPSESLCAQRRAGPGGRRPGGHHRRLQDRDYRRPQRERSGDHRHVDCRRRAAPERRGQPISTPARPRRIQRTMSEVIRVQDLQKIYRMGDVEVPALRGINLTIERGEFVAVMGSSGSGKSTFMNIIGCLDRPTGGNYWLEGEEVGGAQRRRLGAYPQQAHRFRFPRI